MRLRWPFRHGNEVPPPLAGLPAVRADRALVMLAVHAQQIDDRLARLEQHVEALAGQIPAVVAEDRRQMRARTLAETIIDLSDSLDTTVIDLRDGADPWAATA